MGVNSLWDIVGPTAKPVKLEALSRKKLAVDASIWIYQFLKAVRDGEGNALPQSHIVGFFRRICKLLYYGIMPVFVFDGGAPVLKKQTIADRRARREDKTESVTDTAKKLLAIQVQRQAETKPKKHTQGGDSEEYVFLEDLSNSEPSQGVDETDSANAAFRKKDEYHLPTIKEFKVKSDDQRIMPEEEFDELSTKIWNQIEGTQLGEIDPASKEFQNFPLAVQYMLISHLRLKSRLRMGFSKDQLEKLFPDSMEFSKFQIQQVQKRNFYTQKLMDVSGMGENGNTTRRIAGDKDRKYALVKNDDGWTLSLEENDPQRPIKVDEQDDGEKPTFNGTTGKNVEQAEEEESDWDDVPLEDEEPEEQQDFNKALIASIYDQYENNTHGSNAEDEKRLKMAIEESKKDFYNLRNQEKEMLESGILSWGDAPLVDSAQNKKSNEEAIPEKLLEEAPAIPLNQSVLFNPPEGDEEQKADENNKPQVKMDNNEHEAKLTELSDKGLNSKVDDLAGEYAEVFDDSDDQSETEKIRKPSNTIPSWFGNDVARKNPHTISYDRNHFSDGERNERHLNINVEESGLLSWNEAQEILSRNENEAVHVASPDNDDDVIIIADQNNKTKGVPNKEIESTPINMDSSTKQENLKETRIGDDRELNGKEEPQEFEKTKEAPKNLEQIKEQKEVKKPEESEVVMIDNGVNGANNTKEANAISDNLGVSDTKEPNVAQSSIDTRNSERRPHLYDYDFLDREEESLADQLHEEEEDHLNFVSQIKENEGIPIHNTKITDEALLHEQMLKAKRDSDEPTQNMISDVQELLKRFGIPYIIAPMEAEAQCAELMRIGLVDGIITDDSDCFLFGGDKVYKNMFNQKKYVECYSQKDIESHLGLSQDNLIELALLLGSDYTRGVKGIGPVLAVEILAEFGSLEKFKEWFDANVHRTKPPDKSKMTSLQKNLLNRVKNGSLYLSETFPDMVVFDAYKRPEVDSDTTSFKWGIPNLNDIRSYLIYNVGWTQSRVDEVMVPLIRDINRKKSEGTQSTISEFFPQELIKTRKEIGLGKRIKAATERLSKRRKD
ncbi:Piso0_000145 [Millerozyma farinosa CBS 7064]|uniref:Piso0_000145 protein n=1 Tax=Pichia sorbitophila (strain ATCC MYA-4447 / BCRC 22081 / CBS 7064 / NBRC 10061 / NRRL Y-12695) TaxID=559304 RepID=G8YT74_PICSO|nr:Piso0_000145 [Millerozyma farinosa CBS 7064]